MCCSRTNKSNESVPQIWMNELFISFKKIRSFSFAQLRDPNCPEVFETRERETYEEIRWQMNRAPANVFLISKLNLILTHISVINEPTELNRIQQRAAKYLIFLNEWTKWPGSFVLIDLLLSQTNETNPTIHLEWLDLSN